MEHVALALILIAFFVVGLYVVDRRDRSRHTHEHSEQAHAETLAQYHAKV